MMVEDENTIVFSDGKKLVKQHHHHQQLSRYVIIDIT
jgi:hypothetical protein